MKKHSTIAMGVIATLLTVGAVTTGLTQPAKKPARAPVPYKDLGFTPGFDDMMTMLVQPRHIRLYYAGTAKNWEMAAAENRDLRASFDRLIQAIPNYLGNDVKSSVSTFIKPKMDAMDAAIAAADEQKFSGAYKDLTTACNACHTYMEHPFLVIKVPDGTADAAHPDQDFKEAP
jgi:hypothetical protein